MEPIFTQIYETCEWGNNNVIGYNGSSGCGSSIQFNLGYIPFLKGMITKNSIKSVVDLGCGDFVCGPLIYDDLDIVYTGYDTYKKVIEYNSIHSKYSFVHLDFFTNKEDIISGDLCILKDVLQHWSLSQIYTFLDYLVETQKFKYILICNCAFQTEDDTDVHTGGHRSLSCMYYPLKKYNPIKLGNYYSKEISIVHSRF